MKPEGGRPPGTGLKTCPQRGLTPFAFVLPLVLAIPTLPFLSVRWFQMREPTFLVPLKVEPSSSVIRVRRDPYGSGLFGARRSGRRTHRGVDLAAPVGTPVLAAKSGVARVGRVKNGLGQYVEVHHPDGWVTRYAHLEKISIWDRQRVRRGDPIGTVGKSGNARRWLIQSHLHFEIRNPQGETLDPMTVIAYASVD